MEGQTSPFSSGVSPACEERCVIAAGQTKSTRVIRFLTEGTIEAAILKFQDRKLKEPGVEEDSPLTQLQDLDAGSLLGIISEHP